MKLDELYQNVISNKELEASLLTAIKENKVADFLAAQGCEVTPEELAAYFKAQQGKTSELSDAELGAVTGGVLFSSDDPTARIIAGFSAGLLGESQSDSNGILV